MMFVVFMVVVVGFDGGGVCNVFVIGGVCDDNW